MNRRQHRYFIRYNDEPEREVTMTEWVRAERAAGFYNNLGPDDEPGTAGFSKWRPSGERIEGRIEIITRPPTVNKKGIGMKRDPSNPNGYSTYRPDDFDRALLWIVLGLGGVALLYFVIHLIVAVTITHTIPGH